MRRLLAGICAAMFSVVSVCGQQIRTASVDSDDLKTLLAAAGYEQFAFDLSELAAGPTRYDMTLVVKEYESGKELRAERIPFGPNRVMLTDFPEEARGGITPDAMADPDAGVFLRAEKLTVGLFPSKADSVTMLHVGIPSMNAVMRRFALRSLPDAKGGERLYSYHSRPFRIDSFAPGRFLPLVLYGSVWFDARYGIYRFCGERELAPDLSSRMIADIPHFYVIGIEFTEKQEPQE